MVEAYHVFEKMPISPDYECPQHTHSNTFKLGTQPTILGLDIFSNEIKAYFSILSSEYGVLANVESRLLILKEDGTTQRKGNIFKSSTRGGRSTFTIKFDRRSEPINGYIQCAVEIKTTTLPIPKKVDTKTMSDDDIFITVGEKQDKCLWFPIEVVEKLPRKLKELLLKRRHVHLKMERFLQDFLTLDTDHESIVRLLRPNNHEQVFRRGIIFLNYSDDNYAVTKKSPLYFFCHNFENMINIQKVEERNAFIGCNYPKPEKVKFRRPLDCWLDTIDRCCSCVSSSVMFNDSIKLTFNQDNCILRLFSTDYNGVRYFGASLTFNKKGYLFRSKVTLEIRRYAAEDDLIFCLSMGGCSPQYTLSSPILATMEEVKKLEIVHVVVKFENVNQRRNRNVVRFPGINNFTLVSGNKRISLSLEVLKANSLYFVGMENCGFVESNQDTLTLQDDDPDAWVEVIKILYGYGSPLSWPLLANMIVIADKYEFIDLFRYFDLMLSILARDRQLPQLWAINTNKITEKLNLVGLKNYMTEYRRQRYCSRVEEEKGHEEIFDILGITNFARDSIANRTRKRLHDN